MNIRELLAPGPDSLRLRLGLDIRNTGDAIGGGCQQQYEKSGVSTHRIMQNAKPVRITNRKLQP